MPGDPKLGEGKPENQNHAIVFTRGNAVQTIDMNQVKSISLSGRKLIYILVLPVLVFQVYQLSQVPYFT